MPRQTQTKKDVLTTLPEHYKRVAEQIFIHGNHRIYIAPRVKQSNKPPLYLWNLTTKSYLSSLFYVPETDSFRFDCRNRQTDEVELFELKTVGSDFTVTKIVPN